MKYWKRLWWCFILFPSAPWFPLQSSFPKMRFLLCRGKFNGFLMFLYLPAITVVPFSWQRVHPLFFVSSDKILYPLMETMQKYSPPTSLWGSRQTTGKVRHRQTRIAQNMWYNLGQHLQNSCNWQLWLGVCDQLLRPSPVIDYNVC